MFRATTFDEFEDRHVRIDIKVAVDSIKTFLFRPAISCIRTSMMRDAEMAYWKLTSKSR